MTKKITAYQNSGVLIDAIDASGKSITYYRFIDEIWHVDYGENIWTPYFDANGLNTRRVCQRTYMVSQFSTLPN